MAGAAAEEVKEEEVVVQEGVDGVEEEEEVEVVVEVVVLEAEAAWRLPAVDADEERHHEVGGALAPRAHRRVPLAEHLGGEGVHEVVLQVVAVTTWGGAAGG